MQIAGIDLFYPDYSCFNHYFAYFLFIFYSSNALD